MLLKYKTCYATHKNDNGKIATPFRIKLKPNAQLITQRPSKVPIHYRDKLNTLPKDLEKHNIMKQSDSSPQDKPVDLALSSSTPMHIRHLMKTLLNLLVSPLVINFLLS